MAGRQDLNWTRTTFKGGINQCAEDASFEEAAEAINVWRPAGQVERRPGFVGVGRLAGDDQSAVIIHMTMEDNSAVPPVYTTEVAGVFTVPLCGGVDPVPTRDRLYVGVDAADWAAVSGGNDPPTLINIEVLTQETQNCTPVFSYWNGTEWLPLRVVQVHNSVEAGGIPGMMTDAQWDLRFAPPLDWIPSTGAYGADSSWWLRVDLQGDGLTGGVTQLQTTGANTTVGGETIALGAVTAQFPSGHRTCSISQGATGYDQSITIFHYDHTPTGDTALDQQQMVDVYDGAYGNRGVFKAEQPTIAVVPQFGEAFIAFRGVCARMSEARIRNAGRDVLLATPETRDFAVGPGAPYDPAYVAQLNVWPKAKYISFFGGRLWASGIHDKPYMVQWSAAQPYHKVWPSLSYEHLMEDDNSPITGMCPLGEHMIVFKRDSIWTALNAGANSATGVDSFVFKRVSAGIGCASNASIKQIDGRLFFLSELGPCSFDGVNVAFLGDKNGASRIASLLSQIAPGTIDSSCAAHWRKERMYLLAYSADGISNDQVLAYDYTGDTWWHWTLAVGVRQWIETESAADEERLYFMAKDGSVYLFGSGPTDHGAVVSATIRTQRLGLDSPASVRVRAARLCAENKTVAVATSTIINDRVASSGTLSFVDPAEHAWLAHNWNGFDWAPPTRRWRREDISGDGDWAQIEINFEQKYNRLRFSYLDVGMQPLGVR